jgi:hypothetical protein
MGGWVGSEEECGRIVKEKRADRHGRREKERKNPQVRKKKVGVRASSQTIPPGPQSYSNSKASSKCFSQSL